MSDLFGNHIVGFPMRRLICVPTTRWGFTDKSVKVSFGVSVVNLKTLSSNFSLDNIPFRGFSKLQNILLNML